MSGKWSWAGLLAEVKFCSSSYVKARGAKVDRTGQGSQSRVLRVEELARVDKDAKVALSTTSQASFFFFFLALK